MLAVLEQIEQVAGFDVAIHVRGESGTGKELVARAIHERGERSGSPFVAINCAAIPDSLLEAELFGHVRGAFTGAERTRPGSSKKRTEERFFSTKWPTCRCAANLSC